MTQAIRLNLSFGQSLHAASLSLQPWKRKAEELSDKRAVKNSDVTFHTAVTMVHLATT